jgi:thiamine pyrophosphokinase
MSKICYIVGASPDKKLFDYDQDDYIIASDGGYDFLVKNHIVCDLLVGDMDSLCYAPQFAHKIILPKKKDITDTHQCIEEGIKLGYSKFVLVGCLGGRIEHSCAALQDAYHYKKLGYDVSLISSINTITIIKDETIEIFQENGYISIFSLEPISYGVSLTYLLYELDNVELRNDFPLGVSNEFINKKATISVKNGCLLIIY